MSYTEINSREGLPYGGMPYDIILGKLEETNPELVKEIGGVSIEDAYHNNTRSEIIDWTPDAPFAESDHPRRDPALSRSILNLRYNGTRGSQLELPRHPELFYGFTGNDPRGTTNDPVFNEVRGHLNSRASNLSASFQDNSDFHLAERPWTGQSISYSMKELLRRLRGNTHVFSVSKEGRPWSRNYAADETTPGAIREAQLAAGGESLVHQKFSVGVANANRGGPPITQWRHTTGDVDLGVQLYAQKRGFGVPPKSSDIVRQTSVDQGLAESQQGRAANRQMLGALMARAVRSQPDQADTEHEIGKLAGSHLLPAKNTPSIYRLSAEKAASAQVASVTPNTYLTNAEIIVSGLREGTASGLRRIINNVVADGSRGLAPTEAVSGLGRGRMPSADNSSVAKMSEMRLPVEAANLVVFAYRGGIPRSTGGVGPSADDVMWQPQHNTLPIGKAKAPAIKSPTQGLAVEESFELDASSGAVSGGAVRPKSLRPKDSDLSDNLNGYSEGF